MIRRVRVGLRRPNGPPRTSWMSQLKQDTGIPIIATSWSRPEDRQLWKLDATSLTGCSK